MKSSAIPLLCLLLIALPAVAATIHVPSDQPTIAAGLTAASAGDTVLVACGTYYEHGLILPSEVTLRGETGAADCVILDAQGLGRIMECTGVAAGTRIEGITLTHGDANPDLNPNYGGGIFASGAVLEIENCDFLDNVALVGGSISCEAGCQLTLIDCDFDGTNLPEYSNYFGLAVFSDHGDLIMSGCRISNHECLDIGSGGGLYVSQGAATLSDCEFVDNKVLSGGGGIYAARCALQLTRCLFDGNTAGGYEYVGGGGLFVSNQSASVELLDCRFTANSSIYGGIEGNAASIETNGGDCSIVGCLFDGNTNEGSGRSVLELRVSPGPALLSGCSFVGNSNASLGVIRTFLYPISLQNSIIAESSGVGAAVSCAGEGAIAELFCCDIHGNDGGDYTGCLAGQLGINGNISLDPHFCDAAGGNYALGYLSPCAPYSDPNAGCGLIGSEPVGCLTWGGIYEVADVADDQGGQLRVSWDMHELDEPASNFPITEYTLWRRIDARGERTPPGDWEYVLSVPAIGEEGYTAICPTLCDSTVEEGMCWTAVYLTAHTADPQMFYETAPDSGYSVDNLAPSVPENLHFADESLLAWDPPADADFRYFSVYGSESEAFDETAVLLDHTIGTSFDVSSAPHVYYHVTATDFSGNEGAAATISPLTDSDEMEPVVFALHANVPNPFNPKTVIRYDLPAPASVNLRVYDLAGRLVRVLLAEEARQAGRHEATWDGRNDAGRAAASGLYLYRLEAGGFTATKRMTLLK